MKDDHGAGRALALLTAAQAVGQAGTWAAWIAALPLALARPHPAMWLSAIAAAWAAPAVLSRAAGGPIDRWGPRVAGGIAWVIAAVAAALPAAAHVGLIDVLGVLVCVSAGGTWGVAAGQSAPTWMPARPDLARAGSWLMVAQYLPVAAAPIGASALVTGVGEHAAWALVAGLSAAAAFGSLMVPAIRPAAAAPKRRMRMPGAVRRVLAVTAAVQVSYGGITTLEALYVRAVLTAPLTVYGWLLGTWATAGIACCVAARPGVVTARWAVPLSVLVIAAGEGLYVGTSVEAAAFAGAAVFGGGAALLNLSCRAVIVRAVPPEGHGRALSLWESSQCAGFVAPTLVTGGLVTTFGLRAVLDGCAALTGACAALSLGAAGVSRRRSHQLVAARAALDEEMLLWLDAGCTARVGATSLPRS
jgi:hypothetical protein